MRGRYEKIRNSDEYKHMVLIETELREAFEKNKKLTSLLEKAYKDMQESTEHAQHLQRCYDNLLRDYNILLDDLQETRKVKKRWWDRMW